MEGSKSYLSIYRTQCVIVCLYIYASIYLYPPYSCICMYVIIVYLWAKQPLLWAEVSSTLICCILHSNEALCFLLLSSFPGSHWETHTHKAVSWWTSYYVLTDPRQQWISLTSSELENPPEPEKSSQTCAQLSEDRSPSGPVRHRREQVKATGCCQLASLGETNVLLFTSPINNRLDEEWRRRLMN